MINYNILTKIFRKARICCLMNIHKNYFCLNNAIHNYCYQHTTNTDDYKYMSIDQLAKRKQTKYVDHLGNNQYDIFIIKKLKYTIKFIVRYRCENLCQYSKAITYYKFRKNIESKNIYTYPNEFNCVNDIHNYYDHLKDYKLRFKFFN